MLSVGMVSAPRPPLPPASYERAPRKGPLHRGGGGGPKFWIQDRGGDGRAALAPCRVLTLCVLLTSTSPRTYGRTKRTKRRLKQRGGSTHTYTHEPQKATLDSKTEGEVVKPRRLYMYVMAVTSSDCTCVVRSKRDGRTREKKESKNKGNDWRRWCLSFRLPFCLVRCTETGLPSSTNAGERAYVRIAKPFERRFNQPTQPNTAQQPPN